MGRPSRDADDAGSANNFRVCVRIRPENEEEKTGTFKQVVQVLDEQMLVFDPKTDNTPSFLGAPRRRHPRFLRRRARDVKFVFDQVFDADASQDDVFQSTTKPIIDGVLDGYNASVFCYGATGAGKTHTMLGHNKAPGVIVLTVQELFKRIRERQDDISCNVAVSYLEVYNERIRDLLKPSSGELRLREDRKGVVVAGLSVHEPKDASSLLRLLERGNENRTQHPTDANATSSRSHAVFIVHVHQTPKGAGIKADVSVAKMMLIDLAGSERATATRNRGQRMREGANINKSLLALGNCINALASGKKKSCHIPYRNSNLTRILKDSLGGNCRTVMIANCSPSSRSFEDTYNTLNYANRAKNIKVTLRKNVVNVDFHVTRYKKIVESLQSELTSIKTKLRKTQQALEEARKVKPPPSPAPALQEDVLSRGMKSLVPMFQTRRKIIQQITRAEAASRAREADIRKAKREAKRGDWLRHHGLTSVDPQPHVERANADVVRSSDEKLKSDADLKVLGEKLVRNTKENAVWQAGIEKTVGTGLELKMLKYIYQCHAMQCENIGLKMRVDGLHNELRHEIKENARADRVVTVLMKACARMRARLTDVGAEEDKELLESADNALNLALSGKEVAWPDRQSLESKNELIQGTPDKLHTPMKALSAKRAPMRSVNKTYTTQGRTDAQAAEASVKSSEGTATQPCTPMETTRDSSARPSRRRNPRYMSDLSTPDKWDEQQDAKQSTAPGTKRLSSTPLADGNQDLPAALHSPDQSAILPASTRNARRKEALHEVRTSLNLTFDMSGDEQSSSDDNSSHKENEDTTSGNNPDATKTVVDSQSAVRTPAKASSHRPLIRPSRSAKKEKQNVVSKYQRMTAVSRGASSKNANVRSERPRALAMRNGDKQSRWAKGRQNRADTKTTHKLEGTRTSRSKSVTSSRDRHVPTGAAEYP
ncbi:kinesin motor domain-containing protein [Salpingoeca rosetta]|uniref:Kinesin-like protein n=1 Tax=Salpingoeca rosetta (strain ATCC 50818 / BSB-021) TaxID=946362 RepID=F2UAF4_SALR5|nr:kinesin motor domain-containing protein [Salpingoeca rosetta]EGD73729.1 kinesin motor domain-containing protein [Salpingoeca rosetta]|eukprot:XP_004994010.1 kinesin motor domain-containing protein [Salpingoeca rosetta]